MIAEVAKRVELVTWPVRFSIDVRPDMRTANRSGVSFGTLNSADWTGVARINATNNRRQRILILPDDIPSWHQ